MCSFMALNTYRTVLSSLVLAVVVVVSPELIGQEETSEHHKSTPADKPLADQVLELRAMVARLEAALEQNHASRPASAPRTEHSAHDDSAKHPGMDSMNRMDAMKGMGSMSGTKMGSMQMGSMKGMAAMDGMNMGAMPGMGGMQGMNMGSMPGMEGMQGMGGMGQRGMSMMGKMSDMSWSRSALPGFPGASHIYHIGATDFFLDHPAHITLATEQQATLNRLREKAMLKQASYDRQIDEAEQQLWELTSADQPDAREIEAKIREIEKLRADQRLAFIRSVGEAAEVLTDEQRQSLAGTTAVESWHTGPQSHKTKR